MPDWKTRKHGPQKGTHFPSRDPMLLRDFLRETHTHDINTILTRLREDGRQTVSQLREAEKTIREGEKSKAQSESLLEALEHIEKILADIRSTGRTRVGDAELKAVIRGVLQELQIPPSLLKDIV